MPDIQPQTTFQCPRTKSLTISCMFYGYFRANAAVLLGLTSGSRVARITQFARQITKQTDRIHLETGHVYSVYEEQVGIRRAPSGPLNQSMRHYRMTLDNRHWFNKDPLQSHFSSHFARRIAHILVLIYPVCTSSSESCVGQSQGLLHHEDFHERQHEGNQPGILMPAYAIFSLVDAKSEELFPETHT